MARRSDEPDNPLIEPEVNIDFSPLWADEEPGGLLQWLPTIIGVLNLILLIIIWRTKK